MAGEMFPKDELGMMLPIITPRLDHKSPAGWNRHHAWYYARRFLLGEENNPATEGSRILRYTRLQTIPIWSHDRIHYRYKGGSWRPNNEFDEFKLTLLGWAGYIPEKGIQVKKTHIKEVGLRSKQKENLRLPNVFTVESKPDVAYEIGDYVMRYITSHGLEHLVSDQESLVAQYIEEPDSEERVERAINLVRAAAAIALDPFETVYEEARRAEALRVHSPSNLTWLVMPHVVEHVADIPDRLYTSLNEQIYGSAA